MESRYFRGTNKNPVIDYASRKERIEKQKTEKPSFAKKGLKSLNIFKLLNPVLKLFHLSKLGITKGELKGVLRQLGRIIPFVALLLLLFIREILLKISSSKYFPSGIKAKASPFLSKIYIKILNILNPIIPGQISRLSLIELSVRNLMAKKNRTNITIGGMAIGIAAIVFLVSIGYGLQQVVVSRVASLSELKQTDVSLQLGSKIKINDKALSDFKQIPNVSMALPLISLVGTVNYNNSASDMAVYGVQSDYLKNSSLNLLYGHYFSDNELASVLPQETFQEEQTAVLGASTSATPSPKGLSMGSFIQNIQFTLSPTDWVRVRQNPEASSPIIGYTRRTEGVEEGQEVWGGTYISDGSLGKAGKNENGLWFGKWVKSPLLLWEKKPCDPKTEGDCEDGEYMILRGPDGHQVQKEGYFAASNASLTGTSLAEGQVLGVSTDSNPGNGGSIPFVNIASLSSTLKAPTAKIVALGSKAKKQAVVNVAMLNILGIKQNEAVGKTFQTSFTATGDLLNDPSQNLQSKTATYTIVGVISGNSTPVFYVPFIDLRSMGLSNYSQARVIVNSKGDLPQVRRQIESEGFVTYSVADTVAQINSVFSTARTILALVGFVALAVASLGMFNTLTVSLLERTREVGLMKAMGMKSDEIKELFLTESLVMAFFGGVLGIILGFLAGQILSILLSVFSVIRGVGFIDISYLPFSFILIILGLSLIVGLITGIYPARRATKISALNALRYE